MMQYKEQYAERIEELKSRVAELSDAMATDVELASDLQMRQDELNQLRELQRKVAQRLGELEIETAKPDQIHRTPGISYEPAGFSFE